MKSVIEIIYHSKLEDDKNKFERQNLSDEESAAYDALRNALAKDDRTLLERYEELNFNRTCDGGKELYFLGFRTGAKLALELMEADFKIKFP